MNLFILRHGKAEKSSYGTPDAARALTRKGKEEVKKVAQWLKGNKIRFDAIATSPLKRARDDRKDCGIGSGSKRPARCLG